MRQSGVLAAAGPARARAPRRAARRGPRERAADRRAARGVRRRRARPRRARDEHPRVRAARRRARRARRWSPARPSATCRCMAFGPRTVRAVTHLDVSRADCELAAEVLAEAVGVTRSRSTSSRPPSSAPGSRQHHETRDRGLGRLSGRRRHGQAEHDLVAGGRRGALLRLDRRRRAGASTTSATCSASRRASRPATGARSTSRRSTQLRAEGRMRPAGEAAFARRARRHAPASTRYEQRRDPAAFEPEQQAALRGRRGGVGVLLRRARRRTARRRRGG